MRTTSFVCKLTPLPMNAKRIRSNDINFTTRSSASKSSILWWPIFRIRFILLYQFSLLGLYTILKTNNLCTRICLCAEHYIASKFSASPECEFFRQIHQWTNTLADIPIIGINKLLSKCNLSDCRSKRSYSKAP